MKQYNFIKCRNNGMNFKQNWGIRYNKILNELEMNV